MPLDSIIIPCQVPWARLQHPRHEPRADLFSPGLLEQDDRVGAMDRFDEQALEDAGPGSRH